MTTSYGYYLPTNEDEARDLMQAPAEAELNGRAVVGPYSEYEADCGFEEEGPLTADMMGRLEAMKAAA